MPPSPKRLLPTPTVEPPKPSVNVLSRIKPVVAQKKGLKASIYGVPKTGKTRLACTFPKPLLIIGFEDGTESVVGLSGVDFVRIEHTDEFLEVVEGPVKEGKYKTIVVDHASRMRLMKITEILGLRQIPHQLSWGFAKIQQWGECSAAMMEMLSRMWDAAKPHMTNVVIVAQEENLTKEKEGAPQSDLIKPRIGSAVGKTLSDFINAEVDYIMQTCKIDQVIKTEQVIGKSKVVVETRTGKTVYAVRIGPSEIYYTGFRQHINAPPLPNFIEDPTYEKIKKCIEG